MAHDVHFLERLSRVDRAQADRALNLYRDPGLVKALLQDAKVPEGAGRVAIALEEQSSPHLVVARDGAFVTCLAAGMSVGELPVLNRQKLDSALVRITRQRSAEAAFDSLTGNSHRSLARLYAKLFDGGELLDREDVEPLLAIQPLICRSLVHWALTEGDSFTTKMKLAAASPEPASERAESLRRLWRTYWAVNHLMVIAASPEVLQIAEEAGAAIVGLHMQWLAIHGATVGTALRGLWVASRLGRDAVATLKDSDRQGANVLWNVLQRLALVAIALTHARRRGEVRKHLERPFPREPELSADARNKVDAYIDVANAALLLLLDRAEAFTECYPAIVRPGAALSDAALRASLSEACNDPVSMAEAVGGPLVFVSLPGVLGLSPAELFVPADRNARREGASPEQILAFFRQSPLAEASANERPRPLRAEEKPGRNHPCTCGSGKKWKRCCGA